MLMDQHNTGPGTKTRECIRIPNLIENLLRVTTIGPELSKSERSWQQVGPLGCARKPKLK
jgi:hypothetical protein